MWWLLLILLSPNKCNSGPSNTPPVIVLERNWKIPENEPVGSRIERVRGRDAEHDPLVFSLKPGVFLDGSRYFRIDANSGVVYLNQSLQGQAGAQFYLYVTASDGVYESKMEVFVEVSSPGGQHSMPPPHKTSPQPAAPEKKHYPPPPLLPSRTNVILPGAFHPPAMPPPQYIIPSVVMQSKEEVPASPPSFSNNHELGSGLTATIISVLAIIGLAPLVTLGIWLIRKRCLIQTSSKNNLGVRKQKIINLTESSSTATTQFDEPLTFSNTGEPKELFSHRTKGEFPRQNLKLIGILGEGCFGQVWKGQAWDIAGSDGVTTVAVKTLKDNAGERETKDLLSELEIMKSLEPHTNVVRFLGSCTEKDPIYVIMEYVPMGKLQTFLRNSRAEHYYKNLHGSSKSLTSQDLTSFAFQVARAMDFLSSKGIIHRDLAARNILVGENKMCKVADFGFARDILSNHIYERKSDGRLPIRWMAFESLFDNIFSVKTDVWSFGVLMWEIVTLGSTPYPGMAAVEVMQHVRQGHRLEKPDHCKREMYNIMYYCWDKDPDVRPSFSELTTSLEQLMVSETDYIELERFPDHLYYNMISLSSEKL
uniref:receptor protein-tyrosine kinase n=1 Tax=Strigamia maritima TaxID=126957 RepID=T1IHS7_STRMM